jgi:hypothetical protein
MKCKSSKILLSTEQENDINAGKMRAKEEVSIQEIDKISITVLMDNYTDLLLTNSTHATRAPLIMNQKFKLPPPIAEHGFSALVNILKYDQSMQEKNSIDNSTKSNNDLFLFDTGVSKNGVIHNSDVFGIDLDQIEGIFESWSSVSSFISSHAVFLFQVFDQVYLPFDRFFRRRP